MARPTQESDDDVLLRPAQSEDVDLVFAWANDPVTRSVSFDKAPIPYESHVAWFAGQLGAPTRNMLIIERQGQPAGNVRLDAYTPEEGVNAEGTCLIGINIAPEARGVGLGTKALTLASEAARALGFRAIFAFIEPTNVASIRAFEKAGYCLDGERRFHGHAALRYRRDL